MKRKQSHKIDFFDETLFFYVLDSSSAEIRAPSAERWAPAIEKFFLNSFFVKFFFCKKYSISVCACRFHVLLVNRFCMLLVSDAADVYVFCLFFLWYIAQQLEDGNGKKKQEKTKKTKSWKKRLLKT